MTDNEITKAYTAGAEAMREAIAERIGTFAADERKLAGKLGDHGLHRSESFRISKALVLDYAVLIAGATQIPAEFPELTPLDRFRRANPHAATMTDAECAIIMAAFGHGFDTISAQRNGVWMTFRSAGA